MKLKKSLFFFYLIPIFALIVVGTNHANAGELIINSGQSDPVPKKAWGDVIELFKKENPSIKVTVNYYDSEGYKDVIRNWLVTNPPDIVFWFAGNRMRFFTSLGLFEDVTDLWKKNNMLVDFKTSIDSMSVDGKFYGVPVSYYQWGIFYNKEIFKKYKLTPPNSFDELLTISETLKKNGIVPFTIGTRYLWPAAGWFDYLNMRINGVEFHRALMNGTESYQSPKIKKVFETWAKLVDAKYYIENHQSYDWIEANAYLLNGKAAMYLMGNFLIGNIPDPDKYGFFQFPLIDPKVNSGEDAPTDSIHIPSKAKHKTEARLFLQFVARVDIQEFLNKVIHQIPPHKDAKIVDGYFVKEGVDILSKSELVQFYDRDTKPAMAKEGMKAFQEFMAKPERIDTILKKLDIKRLKIFKQIDK